MKRIKIVSAFATALLAGSTAVGQVKIGNNPSQIISGAKLQIDGDNTTTSTPALIIDGNGRMGIGTATPGASLDVAGIPGTVSAVDGLMPPRLTRAQLIAKTTAGTYTAAHQSAMIYVTDASGTVASGTTYVTGAGYYFYNGTDWMPVGTQSYNNLDLGYVIGWTSNAIPPDFLLPLDGGTYNKADYPDFINMQASKPSQFIASQTATTFTLVNINDQRTLRGNTTAGATGGSNTVTIAQNQLPNITLTGTTGGTSAGTPQGTISTAGAHTHTIGPDMRPYYVANNSVPAFLSADGVSSATSVTTSSAGDHTHTFNGQALQAHTHTFTTSSINGGVTQNTLSVQNPFADIRWCIKVKSTSSTASITINNYTGASFSNTLSAATGSISSSVNGITSTLTPTAGVVSNTLGFDATGNLVKQAGGPATVGDVKTSLLTTDHYGWVKLDGRLVSALTSSQQSAAATLGFSTNLPNAANAALLQDGGTPGAISGSNSISIAQNQLPNVTLTTTTAGAHTHTIAPDMRPYYVANNSSPAFLSADGVSSATSVTTSSAGDHTHTIQLNGGVTQQALNITPRHMTVNVFVYLGN